MSRRRLNRILVSIHDSHCKWQPQNLSNLDDDTKKCIMVITNQTKITLNCESLKYTLVGSSAEGLGKPYTLDLKNSYRDQWCRFLLRFFCCCLPCNTSFTSLRTDIDVIIKFSDRHSELQVEPALFKLDELLDKPGFTKILINPVTKKDLVAPWEPFCKYVDDETFLSSALIRNAVLHSVNSIDEHCLPASRIFGPLKHPPAIQLETKGPAVKLEIYPIGQVWHWNENQKFVIFEGDFVFGIHCHQTWPRRARGWLARPRFWPLPSDVQHIAQSGFVLVAKTSKEENDLEWLISFPHSETYLSQRIPQVAKACYLALKIIFKDHLSYNCENLKTYQLKTILFWQLEKHPMEFWEIQNMDQCFMSLLDRLIECVSTKNCPSYWIENINLFNDCDASELNNLVFILQRIRTNPAPYIEDIGSMWC